MKHYNDLTGQKFGRLEVLRLDHKQQKINKNGVKTGNVYYWLCKCECGNLKVVRGVHLSKGLIQSCGCLQKETIAQISKEKRTTHNQSNNRIYGIYKHIQHRCYLTTDKDYVNYGKRGITMCDEWKNNFMSFYDWAMSNGYKENLTIDRIDVNGNYEPNNCRWVTREQQNKNTRRTIKITFNGETHNLREWSNILNISYWTLKDRLNRGWSFERTLSTPVKHQVQALFKEG
jgi:hypothetical protein